MQKRKSFFLPFFFLILSASLEAGTLTAHYNRPDADYAGWNLWAWPRGREGKSFEPAGTDSYGLLFKIDLKELNNPDEAGFIVRKGNWESKEGNTDRYIKTSLGEIWLAQNDETVYSSRPALKPKIQGAYIDGIDKITVLLSRKIGHKELSGQNISVLNSRREKLKIKRFFAGYIMKPLNHFEITLEKGLNLEEDLAAYLLSVKGMEEKNLSLRNILSDASFSSDEEMGARVRNGRTVFRLFSPQAAGASVQVYSSAGAKTPKVFEMKKKEKGLWEAVAESDLTGKFYTYRVFGENPAFRPRDEWVDIYSRCNTGRAGKGLIINDRTAVAPSPSFPVEDSIIYELHVRDLTIDENSGVKNKGLYPGLTEKGTRYKGMKTCLDHIIELGVNTVQILPVQDFDNDEEDRKTYNWGYMPLNFFSPDGVYSTKTDDGSRVREFKAVVDAFHKNGIKVIMDVVYNHASAASSFEPMCPDYYFRKKSDGTFWNGSGCGNEFQSEYPMARKFILDSLKYWVKEYGVDGFRFDLMGLIDTDTMILISEELHTIKKDILIYGEPWSAGATPCKQTLKGAQKGKGFGAFNDTFRDAVKGSVFGMDYGYVQGQLDTETVERIKRGIAGSIDDFTESPLESINYVESHDNHTLYDRLLLSLKRNNDPKKEDADFLGQLQKTAGALVLLSQGIPFMQAGQELCRTKKGEDNSYNKDDSINKISWEWKERYSGVFEYTKGLIRLRKEHPAFKMRSAREIRSCLEFIGAPYGCVYYQIKYPKDTWKRILVLINPHRLGKSFTLLKGEWTMVVNDKKAGVEPLQKGLRGSLILPPASVCVLYQ